MKKWTLCLCTLLLFFATVDSFAQTTTEVELTRAQMEADRKVMIANNLGLTEEEAAAFWPVYREYRSDLAKIGDRAAHLIGQYANNWGDLSEELSNQLLRDFVDIQLETWQTKKQFINRFLEILPATKVARFYQIENKLDAVVKYELADSIPLVE